MDLFFIFIIIAIFSYGIQLPLLIKYARELDGLTTTIYRNLSLMITMAPLLFFAPIEDFAKVPDSLWLLIGASGTGALAFVFNLTAATYLPASIAQSIRQAGYVIVAITLGALFMKEYLSGSQLIIVFAILASVILLALSNPSIGHLKKQNKSLGMMIAAGAGIFYAISFMLYSAASRNISPFIAGYFLEVGVGISAILFGVIRYSLWKIKTPILSLKDSLKIGLISMTTISGTLCYGFAVNNGPYALASALMTTTGIITLIAGYIMFKEKLSKTQVGLVLLLIGCIIVLKIIA